jgi:3',5'-nucleoside bisphosphate phosphatase
MRYDLHVHTTASDGVETPEAVVRAAHEAGLAGIAIADHDTTAGLPAALVAGEALGLEVLPAVEVTANAPIYECHILGYFVSPTEGPIQERLTALRRARVERAREILRRLREAGLDVTEADVVHASGPRAIQRSDIARLLVAKGYASEVREAMRTYLSKGTPAYVPAPSLAPAEAVATIRADGGAAVLAHPGITGQDSLIEGLVEAGLVGIEAGHPAHTEEHLARYDDLARRYGLIRTEGSDYHGADSKWRVAIGPYGVDRATLDALYERRG